MPKFNGHNELQRLSHEYGKEEVLRGFLAAILTFHFEEYWDENKHLGSEDAEAAIYNAVECLPYEWAEKAHDDVMAEVRVVLTDYPEPSKDDYLGICLERIKEGGHV